MKKEDLFRAMNDIDDDLLLQSEKKVSLFMTKKVGIGFVLTALACCLLVVGLNIPTKPQPPQNDPPIPTPPKQVDPIEPIIPNYPDYVNPFIAPFVPPNYSEGQLAYNPNLPKLDANVLFSTQGMGTPFEFEGDEIRNIQDLLNENTWNENIVYKELPVYKNEVYFTVESLTEIFMEVAGQINMNITKDQIKVDDNNDFDFPEDYFEPHIISLTGEDEKYILRVDGDEKHGIDAFIELKTPRPIQKGLFVDGYNSLKNVNNYAHFYKEKITETFNLKDPQIRITGGYYSTMNNHPDGYQLTYVEKDSQIFDIFSKRVDVYSSDDGQSIWALRVYFQDNREKIADYPVISVGKAKAMLLEEKFFANAPKPDLKVESILKTEMIYRYNLYSDVVIPFYKFTVKAENQKYKDQGLITVASYYVPAIEEQYLTNQTYWKAEIK